MENVASTDPYEQKLYHMFKSFDVQSKGSLDKESLIKLCTTLELKDRAPKLVACLIDRPNSRVTFKQFKEGLLNLLGTDDDVDLETTAAPGSQHRSTIGESGNDSVDDANPVDIISKSREVSPILVVAGKKYGRRSRPQSAAAFDSSSSHSDSDASEGAAAINEQNTAMGLDTSKKSQKVQRSASQSDMHGGGQRRMRPSSGGGTKLKRCASLPAQQKQRVAVDDKRQLKTQLESSVESLGNLDFENLSLSLYKAWNRISDDADDDVGDGGVALATASTAPPRHNQSELEAILVRVGVQDRIAGKVADEVFEKLGRTRDEAITFDDFVSLIQSDVTPIQYRCTNDGDDDDTDNDANSHDILRHCDIIADLPVTTISSLDMHAPHTDEKCEWPVDTMAADIIVEMWEMAHVKDAAQLLENLGFTGKEVNVMRLSAIIDEELQDVQQSEKSFTPLLRASLALHKTEVIGLQKALRNTTYENKQLHTNIQDLNRRAYMMAQEVDERHAALEASARCEMQQLENRHSDILRELTAQLTADREQWSTLNAKLEKRIRQIEAEDAKHKQELIRLQDENGALEKEQIGLQNQIAELLETNIKLNNEIADADDRQRSSDGYSGIRETEEVLELQTMITNLQVENANLRDKNDELITELEDLHIEMSRLKTSRKPLRFDQATVSANADDSSSSETGSNSATKRRGDSPSKAKLAEESPRLGKLRKCDNDNSEAESEASGDWMALNSELNQSNVMGMLSQNSGTTSGFSQETSSLNDSKDDEIKTLKSRLVDLDEEVKALRQKYEDATTKETTQEATAADNQVPEAEAKKHVARIQELEASLEQMQREYEACEDYWQGKLNEERQLYEEEQRISDEKFNELLKKMAEYEEQFSSSTEKDGRLSPIEEKCQLEQQYADLEEEVEEFRDRARAILDEKSGEVAELQAKVNALQQRLGEQTTNGISRSSDIESSASSPISYLWHQSTIQAPTRDYQNPNWARSRAENSAADKIVVEERLTISPIQRPQTPSSAKTVNLDATLPADQLNDDDSSSVRSFGTHSIASTHSIHRSLPDALSTSPNVMREDIKRLKLLELQLKDEVKTLAHQRDGLVMELQQLQEAKPVLEKAYARTPHPSLIQRIQQLEGKNRQLQYCLKQQQHYTESIMHQTWQQQRTEINELRGSLETQGIIINEQAQRLANSDLLVKDLYVENSQLTAAIQRLEQQRSRSNILLQQHQGISSMPGML